MTSAYEKTLKAGSELRGARFVSTAHFGKGMRMQEFVKAIHDLPIFEHVANTVQPIASRAFREQDGAGRDVKNFMSGTWLGHPLHPILKDIPIGAWTMTALFDAASSNGDLTWQRAADFCLVTGLAGALASAVTGLSDWSDTSGRARRVGVAHALLNVSATALYAASLSCRRRNDRAQGIALGLCGYGALMLGGYLGGHLVFGQQTGVNHAAKTDLPTDFEPVAKIDDLADGELHRVKFHGMPVLLARRGERICAMYERCSHMGGPLSRGTLEGDSVRCPWHGSRFSLEDGSVLEGPATMPQPCFEARAIDGQIQIRARETESP